MMTAILYYENPTMMIFGLLFLAILCLAVFRTIYILRSIRKIRQSKNPQSICPPSFFGTNKGTKPHKPLKTLVVLGSGGHTTEMLHLLHNLSPERYTPIVLVVAATDTTSLQRVQAYPKPLPINLREGNHPNVYHIPRSREVGQSYWTSIGTTVYSFLFAFWLVGVRVQPDLVLINGPGTCLPIAVSAFLFRIIGWKTSKVVFVESFCRVTSLSLTGRLLYPIADLFVVCWEELQEKFPHTHLVTSFVPRSSSSSNNNRKK